MKTFVRLTKNEMKMVIGGTDRRFRIFRLCGANCAMLITGAFVK